MSPQLFDMTELNEMILFWIDERSGVPSIYAQKIKSDGKPSWQYNGIPVSTLKKNHTTYDAHIDNQGHLWVAFNEEDGYSYLPKIQKVDLNGKMLFGEEAKLLYSFHESMTARLDELKMVSGKNGDIYLAWKDFRNGHNNADIYIQRVDTTGKVFWRKNGIPVCVSLGEQSRPFVFPIPNGVIVGWVDRREKNNENLYIQKFDTLGNILWTYNGFPICTAPKSQNDLQMIDANSNILLSWTDSRDFATTGFDLYLQLITENGEALLAKNGVCYNKNEAYQNTPSLISDKKGSGYLSWMDDRNGNYNLYLQKISPRANPLWRQTGLPIHPAKFHQRNQHMILLNNDDVCVSWSDERVGLETEKIYSQKFTSMGSPMWKKEGVEVGVFPSRQILPKITQDSSKNVIITWLDNRNLYQSDYNLFTQKIDTYTGKLLWNPAGVKIAELMQENSDFTVASTNKWNYFFWHQKAPSGYQQIYLQAISSETGKLMYAYPKEVHQSDKHQTHPNCLVLESQKLFISWLEKDNFVIEDKVMIKVY